MRKIVLVAAALAVAAVFALALPTPASACSGVCVRVPGSFCSTCTDAGEETGAACHQQGSCVCVYDQCPLSPVQGARATAPAPVDVQPLAFLTGFEPARGGEVGCPSPAVERPAVPTAAR